MADRDGHGEDLPMAVLEACPDLESLSLNYSTDGGYAWCTSPHIQGLKYLSVSNPEFFGDTFAPLASQKLSHLVIHAYLSVEDVEWMLNPPRKFLSTVRLVELRTSPTTTRLVNFFSEKSFPFVRHLILDSSRAYDLWPKLLASLSSLITLTISERMNEWTTAKDSIIALGVSATATLQNLVFESTALDDRCLSELLRVIKLPNLEGLRRIEIPMVVRDELASETGRALLEECEKRSISLLSRYGYMSVFYYHARIHSADAYHL
ncbi:hypothetical protein RQP46_010298 [Phenoliferia psychrophenolica]